MAATTSLPTKKGQNTNSNAIIEALTAEENTKLRVSEEDHRAPRAIVERTRERLAEFPVADPKSREYLDAHLPAMQGLKTSLENSPPPPVEQTVTPAFRTGFSQAVPSTAITLAESRQAVERFLTEATANLASAGQRGCKTEENIYALASRKASGLKDRIVAIESQGSSLPSAADAVELNLITTRQVEDVLQCLQHIKTTVNEHSPVDNGFHKVVAAADDIFSGGRRDRASSTTQGIVEANLSRGAVKGEAALVADVATAEQAASTEAQALVGDVNKLAGLVQAYMNNHGECEHPSPSMFGVATAPAPAAVPAPEGTPSPSPSDGSAPTGTVPVPPRTLSEIANSVRGQMSEAQSCHDRHVDLSDEVVKGFTGQAKGLVGQLVLSQKNEAAYNEYAQVMFEDRSPSYFEAFVRSAAKERSNQVSFRDQLNNQIQSVYDDTVATLAGHVRFHFGQLVVGDRLLALIDYITNDFGSSFVDELGVLLEDARRAKLRLAIESAYKVAELYGEARYYALYIILQLEREIADCDEQIKGHVLALQKLPPGPKKDKSQAALTEAQTDNAAYKADLERRRGSTEPNIFLDAVLQPKQMAAQERLTALIRMGLDEAAPPPGLALVPVPTVNGSSLMDPVLTAQADFESIVGMVAAHIATQQGGVDGGLKLLKCESG